MIGILDWGIGGIGFYAMLKHAVPDADVVYLSDNGSAPYGTLGRDILRERVSDAVSLLAEHGAERVVVACNAASTIVPSIRKRFVFPVEDIIEHGIAGVLDAGVRSVGVIGGGRTIRSGMYRRELGRRDLDVRQRVAQPLSALIEAGEWEGEGFLEIAGKIIRPLQNCDALLLACTHYPAAHAQFAKLLPETLLLDPAVTLLNHALRDWEIRRSSASDHILTTGDPDSMRRGACLAFGVELENIEVRGWNDTRPGS